MFLSHNRHKDGLDGRFILIIYYKYVIDSFTMSVLTRKQVFRRLRTCNPSFSSINSQENYSRICSLLGDVHSPAGISDANFDVVESRDAVSFMV